ncbi:MAG: Gfo/Idh/MocA family protein [Halobacteriaceae archaeon]
MTHRIAIAGIGAVADLHADCVAEIDGAEVVAGSCRTESKGREFAEEHDARWFPETDLMLDETDPDVLIVCTPSGAHLTPTVEAAERGVHVLCEKPLEITTERVDKMIVAANEGNIRLGGVFQQRFDPSVQRVHEAATEGRFGDLSVGAAYVPWWRDDDYYRDAWQGTESLDGGGALMNQSIHGVDAIQWLAGAAAGVDEANPVEEVVAFTDRRAHADDLMEVEDTAVASIRFRGGALGQILAATSMYPGSDKRLQLAGRDGTVEVRDDEISTWEFRDADEGAAESGGDGGGGGSADPMSIGGGNHRRNIEAFLDAIESGEEFLLDAHEARKAVEIVEAVYESAETGEPVRL